MSKAKKNTQWHQLFAHMLDLLLTPHGVSVEIEVSVMSDPPRTDILLIRRHTPHWTKAQLRYLPNGLRESTAAHNLIELKVTESVSPEAITKLAADRLHYRENRELPAPDVAAFLISAKQPRLTRLTAWGFERDQTRPGIYHNTHPLAHNITLVSLNELNEGDHNAFVQLFASQKKAKQQAQQQVWSDQLDNEQDKVQWFLNGLLKIQGEKRMTTATEEWTKEEVIQLGRQWAKSLVATLPPEERLMGLRPEERLIGLRPEERLMGLRPEERLMGLRPEERLMGLRPEEIVTHLEPEERLIGLTPTELDQLALYIEQLRQASKKANE